MVDRPLRDAAVELADTVMLRFFDADGRLTTLPKKQAMRVAALDVVAARFVPGVHYTELEINRELMAVFDDYVGLRRELVDFGFLDRADGSYWRSGGTVQVW